MLLKSVAFKNFRKFKDQVVVNFDQVNSGYGFNNDLIDSGLVNTGVLYGRNSEGKTSVLQAVSDLGRYLGNGCDALDSSVQVHSWEEEIKVPTEFIYTFVDKETGKDVKYTYRRNNLGNVTYEDLVCGNSTLYHDDFKFDAPPVVFGLSRSQMENILDIKRFRRIPSIRLMKYLRQLGVIEERSVAGRLLSFASRIVVITDWTLNVGRQSTVEELIESLGFDKYDEFMKDWMPSRVFNLWSKSKDELPSLTGLASQMYVLFAMDLRVGLDIASLILLDDFDLYMDFESAVDFYKKLSLLKGQVLVSTNNIGLMDCRLVRPDTVFIVSDGHFSSLYKSTDRVLSKDSNLGKLYRSGEFD